jgi:hypothetical protein
MKMLYEYPLDTAAQIEYARRWALSRNPAYYDFDSLGGDCTNFVSQCIYAGGAVMNYTRDLGWYYISPRDRAAAWSGVEYFFRFMTTNKGVGPFGEQIDLSQAQAGDVVQLGNDRGFYHSLFVLSAKNGIRIAAHSYDAYGKPLSDYDFDQARCIHIIGSRKML